jgi:hypothetical protein
VHAEYQYTVSYQLPVAATQQHIVLLHHPTNTTSMESNSPSPLSLSTYQDSSGDEEQVPTAQISASSSI